MPGDVSERVAQCSYELYEMRGREDGHDIDDWLKAEQEITRVVSMMWSAELKWLLPNRRQLAVMTAFLFLSLLYRLLFG